VPFSQKAHNAPQRKTVSVNSAVHTPPLCFLSIHFASQTAPAFTAISERNKIPNIAGSKNKQMGKKAYSV
jgi:hypothetical protein